MSVDNLAEKAIKNNHNENSDENNPESRLWDRPFIGGIYRYIRTINSGETNYSREATIQRICGLCFIRPYISVEDIIDCKSPDAKSYFGIKPEKFLHSRVTENGEVKEVGNYCINFKPFV
jgi:hypothetical protein